MEKMTYTREEVLDLLEKQRKLCYEKAKIKTYEYVNPYSASDGEISHAIDRDSILKSKIEI